MNYIIRPARKQDMERIIVLCQAHAEYERSDYDPDQKEEILSRFIFRQNLPLHCLVVEKAEALVGYATFMKQFSTWDAEYYVYLDCLYLEPQTRGRGIGTQIMEEVKAFARAEDCSGIQWQTPDFNEKAIRFYQKIGGVHKAKERFFLEP